MGRWFDAAWLVALAAASSAYCVTSAGRIGATFDEPFYVAAGLKSWQTGSTQPLMLKGTMPLPVDAATLPLYLWERDRGVPFDPVGDLPRLLPVARAAALPFWWLLLLYGLLWGRVLGGPWAGRLACGFLAVEPNLLAHAALATTDIALTATVLAAAYHWHVGRPGGRVRRWVVPGVWYGVALTAKASAMVYVPLIWAVLSLGHLSGRWPAWARPWAWLGGVRAATVRPRWDFVSAAAVAVAFAFAYCGCDWRTEPTFVAWAHSLADGPLKSAMVPVAENLPIFSNAGEGLVQQVKHNVRGHGTYLLGEWHPRAVWYYFPVAVSAKLTEPTLLLFVGVLVLRPRLNPALWVAVALFAFSLNARVQIGVRLVFPLFAFLLIGLAVACATLPRRRLGLGAGFVAMAATGVLSLAHWPDPIRYTNRLWGGTDRGYEVLSDSNYDWGHGLPELAGWWGANGEPDLHVWYYGADPAILLTPFRVLQVHNLADATPASVTAAVADGYLAVGLSILHGCPDRKPATLAMLAWLHTLEPVGRTREYVVFKLR